MKTEITPKKVEQFNEEGKPAIVSIGNKGIVFNRVAEKLLCLKSDSYFLLEFDEGNLYYKDSAEGFRIHMSGKMKLPTSNSYGIGKYIDTFFKKGVKVFRLEIGEFKDGRRKLNMLGK